jgi:hypothetical protein
VARRRLDVEALADLGDDAGDVGGSGAEVLPQVLGRAGEDVAAHRLGEGQIGSDNEPSSYEWPTRILPPRIVA